MLFVRDLWYVCACVFESSEASAYSFGLATNPNPTRARSYPLNINPKPDPKPDSISGPAGSGRVADLYKSYSLQRQSVKHHLLFFVIFFVQSAFSTPRCRSHWLIQAIKGVIRV